MHYVNWENIAAKWNGASSFIYAPACISIDIWFLVCVLDSTGGAFDSYCVY